LFYNIAGGTVHQIRREKRTTISEVIVCGKRNIKQNRIGFISNFLLKARVLFYRSLNTKFFTFTKEITLKNGAFLRGKTICSAISVHYRDFDYDYVY